MDIGRVRPAPTVWDEGYMFISDQFHIDRLRAGCIRPLRAKLFGFSAAFGGLLPFWGGRRVGEPAARG